MDEYKDSGLTKRQKGCCLDHIWHLMEFCLIFIPSQLGQKGKAGKVRRVMNRFICYIHSRKITSTKRCHIYRGCLTSHTISAMKNPHVRFKWLSTRDCTGSSNKVCYTFTFLSHIFSGIQSEFFFFFLGELLVSMRLNCYIFKIHWLVKSLKKILSRGIYCLYKATK